MAAAKHVVFVRSEWRCLSAEEDLSQQTVNK